MKNTLTIQINKKTQILNETCIITYQGKEIILSNTRQQSYERFFREIFHGFTSWLIKISSFLGRIRIGKGFREMRRKNIVKHEDEQHKLCPQCCDCSNANSYWDSYRVQNGLY